MHQSGACGLQAAGKVGGTRLCVAHCYLWVFVWDVAWVGCVLAEPLWHSLAVRRFYMAMPAFARLCHTPHTDSVAPAQLLARVDAWLGLPDRLGVCVCAVFVLPSPRCCFLLLAAADNACKGLCQLQGISQTTQSKEVLHGVPAAHGCRRSWSHAPLFPHIMYALALLAPAACAGCATARQDDGSSR